MGPIELPVLCGVETCPKPGCGTLTEWKIGPAARALTLEDKRRGKWVSMGRVNSFERLSEAAYMGVDSVDGTYLSYGPTTNLKRLERWLRELAFLGPQARSPASIAARAAGVA